MNWRKSSYSSGEPNTECIEVANLTTSTAVRDSKNPSGAKLSFSTTEWAEFVTAAKTANFA